MAGDAVGHREKLVAAAELDEVEGEVERQLVRRLDRVGERGVGLGFASRSAEAAGSDGEDVSGDLYVLPSLAECGECALGVGKRKVDLTTGEQRPRAGREDRRRLIPQARLELEVAGGPCDGLLEVSPKAAVVDELGVVPLEPADEAVALAERTRLADHG